MKASVELRGAVVGCGMIAEFHLRGWARIPGVKIVALVDPNPEAARNRSLHFAPTARCHGDLESMLAAETLDFIDIISPPAFHREHCLRAKAADLHVICQKPLCDRLSDAEALVAAFAASRKLFCVHENHIYRPWFQRVRTLYREGALGSLSFVRLQQHDRTAPLELFKRDSSHGSLLDYGVHLADMIRTLLGTPERVAAQFQRLHPAVRGESLAHVTYEYPDTLAVIDIAWKNGGNTEGEALFLGNQGEASYRGTMTRGGSSRFRISAGGSTLVDENRETVPDYVDSFYSFQSEFIESVRNGTPGPQPATENLQTLAMIFAAYQSAETGMPVNFSDFVKSNRIPSAENAAAWDS